MTCRICGARKRTLIGHITLVHGCNDNEYLMDYPGEELVCEEQRAQTMKLMGKKAGRRSRRLIPHWEPVWSPEYVLERIAEFRRRVQAGLPTTVAALRKGQHRDRSRVGAALREFGKWSEAVGAAGVT